MKPEYESTPGVVSHMPAFPGSLYLIVTLLGDVMVVTPVGSTGSCLASLRSRGPSKGLGCTQEARAASTGILGRKRMLDIRRGYGKQAAVESSDERKLEGS
jgi:hypothetical protein